MSLQNLKKPALWACAFKKTLKAATVISLTVAAFSVLHACVQTRRADVNAQATDSKARISWKERPLFLGDGAKRSRLLIWSQEGWEEGEAHASYLVQETKKVRVDSDAVYSLEFLTIVKGSFDWEPDSSEVEKLLRSSSNVEYKDRYENLESRQFEGASLAKVTIAERQKAMKEFLYTRGGMRREEHVKNLLYIEETKKNMATQERKMGEIVNFVLNQYQERRNWSDAFQASLQSTAFIHADQSVYLTVRRLFEADSASTSEGLKQGKQKGQIVATIRFIKAPYGLRIERTSGAEKRVLGPFGPTARYAHRSSDPGNPFADEVGYQRHKQILTRLCGDQSKTSQPELLPMEFSLNMSCERLLERKCEPLKDNTLSVAGKDILWCAGEIYEPGNFAILRKEAKIAKPLLYNLIEKYMSKTAKEISHPSQFRLFYTYNDLPSLYKRIGFEVFGEPIDSYGTQWKMLSATPEKLGAFLKKWNASSASNVDIELLNQTMKQDACKLELTFKRESERISRRLHSNDLSTEFESCLND